MPEIEPCRPRCGTAPVASRPALLGLCGLFEPKAIEAAAAALIGETDVPCFFGELVECAPGGLESRSPLVHPLIWTPAAPLGTLPLGPAPCELRWLCWSLRSHDAAVSW